MKYKGFKFYKQCGKHPVIKYWGVLYIIPCISISRLCEYVSSTCNYYIGVKWLIWSINFIFKKK